MCLMLYFASDADVAPVTSVDLYVEPIDADAGVVRQWLTRPEARFIGAHTGCSCGFPFAEADEPVEFFDGMFDGRDDREKDLASVRALFRLIDEALERSELVELFPVWTGDEADAPIGVLHVRRRDLDAERFLFTEHFLYRVTR